MNLFYVKIIVMFFALMSFVTSVSASEDMVLQKYLYGLRQFSQVKGERYLPAVIELLPYTDLKEDGGDIKIYPYYEMGEYENKMEQNKHQVDIHLTIQQKSSSTFATVSFYNRSMQAYFVHRSRLVQEEEQSLCGDSFSIATEGISLVYLGWRCQFEDEDNDEKPDWVEISPGKNFSYTVKLNDAYLFPPGKRRYNIGTLEFFMANDTFFYEKRIFNQIFSILNWKFENCEINKYSYFFKKINELCKFTTPWNKDTAEGLLRKFSYYGLSTDSYFEARSNQVIIEIDGDKLTSPYDMGTTRFSN
ncbi:hypothetical protein [Buttiauxella izardii]|uniref:Uncharacterized protein n=1 Tax=Buttiauxella izardii TaxID=82991 RepID=A0A3A5JN25_9ENTR|nr:hypothetical protein [Buttiauxella izardii]RJT19202.1 hypothetical protein D6029_19130 [Buttiauxella izardii]